MAAEPPPSLLAYDAPLLVDGPAAVAAAAAAAAKRVAMRGAASQLEDIITSMLPPRMWEQADGTTWMQYVSKAAASRADVATLQQALEERLEQRQARLTGLCPVRAELYTQTFDELIRQVTLDLPERGLLLLRVRDEIRMTLDAYRTLYESSMTFGVKKQLQAEQGMSELEARVGELSERKRVLEAQVLALRSKLEVAERRVTEKKALDEKRRADELAYLKHQTKHLDSFLKSMPKTTLKDDDSLLADVGLVDGKSVMALVAPQSTGNSSAASSSATPLASVAVDLAAVRNAELERISKAASKLASFDVASSTYSVELCNQDGTPLRLPKAQQAALQEGLALYSHAEEQLEKGARLRRQLLASTTTSPPASDAAAPATAPATATEAQRVEEQLQLALGLFLRADTAFAKVDPKFLAIIDNHAHLCLQIVWTYFLLRDLSAGGRGTAGVLAAAADYLRKAEAGFKAAHGDGLERLVRLKGADNIAADRMLYVRLHLLQGVLAYHSGASTAAALLLARARGECDALSVDPGGVDVDALRAMGFKRGEAVAALRATAHTTGGSGGTLAASRVGAAVCWASDQRAAAAHRAEQEARREAQRARLQRLGHTSRGDVLNLQLLDSLIEVGFTEQLAAEALRQANNNSEQALMLLTGRPEALLAAIHAAEEERRQRRQARLAQQARQSQAAAARARPAAATAATAATSPHSAAEAPAATSVEGTTSPSAPAAADSDAGPTTVDEAAVGAAIAAALAAVEEQKQAEKRNAEAALDDLASSVLARQARERRAASGGAGGSSSGSEEGEQEEEEAGSSSGGSPKDEGYELEHALEEESKAINAYMALLRGS